MSVYQSSPGTAPDAGFEPGALRHLVAGNRGRMLDPRRTPVSVVAVRPAVGFVDLRIEGFEDRGAVWEIPLEQVGHYQFEPSGPRADVAEIAEMQTAIDRLDHEVVIEPTASERRLTEERIIEDVEGAAAWLAQDSRFIAEGRPLPDPSTRRGDSVLAVDFEAYLRGRDLWALESAFATQFVSNPGSGELVKGHRMVLAELGLAPYAGAIVRDPSTFAADRSREARATHIIARLAFIRALFAALGIERVRLWRGLSADEPLRSNERRTFVSSSFDEAVARSHFEGGTQRPTRVLAYRPVPVARLFMTYHETAAMNDRYLEAEAVLLAQPNDDWP